MARRANYGFEKRQREIKKAKKKAEKAARKLEEANTSEHASEEAPEGGRLGASGLDRD